MKELVEDIVAEWQPKLGLSQWNIHVKLSDTPHPDDKYGDITDTEAEVEVEWVYLDAYLTIFPAFFKLPFPGQRETIVHELVHCQLREHEHLLDLAREGVLVTDREKTEVNERTTETFTRLILGAYGLSHKGD